MWMNYDAIMDKNSAEFKLYGYLSKDIALNEVSKPVGIIASFLSTIRTFAMIFVLIYF